jgi:hypothetical protein
MVHESLVIILSAGGSPIEADTLADVAGVEVTWQRLEREGVAACLAARVRHRDQPVELRARLRRWGAARGWRVTVAPTGPLC